MRDRYREAGFWSSQPADVVRAAAARHPDGLALATRGAELSYADLDLRIDATCGKLAASGVGASTPTVVVVGNDVESVVAVHATLRLDAVVLLVPRSAGETQVADIIARTGAEFGVAPKWPAALRPGLSERLTWISLDTGGTGQTVYRSERAADEPCLVLYTSGTTSVPKGVVHSQSTLMKASSNYIAAAGLGPADRILLISPLASVTGVLQALFIGPMLCVPVILEDKWDAAETCELLVSSGATWYGGPDRLLDRLLDEAVQRVREVPLQAVYLGGTMLDRRIVTRIEDGFGIIVMRAYGSSEVPVSTSGLRSEPADVRHADDGVALQDVEVRLGSAADLAECCIRGPHTFLGYTDAADDAQAFEGDWFRTGDVAEICEGRVRIFGRLKDIIIRNGLKIAAVEVEEAVARVAGVRECAAYSVSDAVTGERLAVAMVLDADIDMSLAKVADALITMGLPKYKLPEELVFWNEPLPVNANGKVERSKLAARSAGRPRVLADRLATTG
ncbi:MAG: AMP-binding protein [Mycobacterium sp.]|nr:AMP-binding protein [Mycobacterium sp.]